MSTPVIANTPYVWTMAASTVAPSTSATYDWDWSKWTLDPRLSVIESARSTGAMGSATFDLLRKIHAEPSADFDQPTSSLQAGVYVLITSAVTIDASIPGQEKVVPDIARIDWFGVVTEIDYQSAGGGDSFGTVTAKEVGECILDNVRVNGWRQETGVGGYGTQIISPPTANLVGSGGIVVGNAVFGINDNAEGCYLFTRDLSTCSSNPLVFPERFWTPWRLLTHITEFCRPAGLPAIKVVLEDGSGTSAGSYIYGAGIATGTLGKWLDTPTTPEVYDLDGLTIKGALDLVAGSSAGLGWRILPAFVGGAYVWQITIYSRSAVGASYGPPKKANSSGSSFNSIVNYTADDSYTHSVQLNEDDSMRYDQVIVRGSQLLFGGSYSFIDGNLDKGWSAAQETAYIAATDAERSSPKFADVYTSYLLQRSSLTTSLRVAASPGNNGAKIPATPLVTWTSTSSDGSGIAEITIALVDSYMPSLRVASFIPWVDGVDPATGLTAATPAGDNGPSYVKPQVFAYDSSLMKWGDILSRVEAPNWTPFSESPSVAVDDRRPGVLVSYSRAHALGKGTFTGSTNGGAAANYDWRTLILTLGVPSDQRVEASKIRSGITSSQIRKTLIIRDDSFRFWAMLSGSVLGVKADNSAAIRCPENRIIVNDWASAQRWCNQLSEWAFRRHISATIVSSYTVATDQLFQVGHGLHNVTDSGLTTTVDGIIATVSNQWRRGTITVQTELSPQPMRGGSSPSPSSGGATSPELGGTLAQVVQKQGSEQKRIAMEIAQRPLIPAMGGGGATAANIFIVQGMNPLPGVGLLGVQKRTDSVLGSEMPVGTGGVSGDTVIVSALPSITAIPLGVGIALRLASSTEYIWVVNDINSPFSGDIGMGQRMTSGGLKINLDKVFGGITYRYVCEVPWIAG